jgi:hypothetical protein
MTPINPATPEAPRIYASPVVPVDTTATPAAINPSATPATMTPNASVGMSSGTYSSMDSDGDGKVSAAEYSRYQSRTSAAATSPTENTPPAEKRGFWSRMFHGEDKSVKTGAAGRSNPTFIDLDTNHDGYLSQTELDAGNSLKK